MQYTGILSEVNLFHEYLQWFVRICIVITFIVVFEHYLDFLNWTRLIYRNWEFLENSFSTISQVLRDFDSEEVGRVWIFSYQVTSVGHKKRLSWDKVPPDLIQVQPFFGFTLTLSNPMLIHNKDSNPHYFHLLFKPERNLILPQIRP